MNKYNKLGLVVPQVMCMWDVFINLISNKNVIQKLEICSTQ